MPIRLVEESLLNDEVTPLLTYDFLELTTAEQVRLISLMITVWSSTPIAFMSVERFEFYDP